nr:MAG: protein m36 [Herpesviridae sp.]
MVPFGRLQGKETIGNNKYRMIMLMGIAGRIYCYDMNEDAVFLLGNSIHSFAKDGLRRLDSIYRDPDVAPRMLIDGVLCSMIESQRDLRALEDLVRQSQGVVYDVSGGFRHLDPHFMLYRGDFGEITIGSVSAHVDLSSVLLKIYHRMSCVFAVIGLLGFRVNSSVFRPRLVIIVDSFGAVYGFDNWCNRVTRLADDFKMFTRMVGQKSVYNFRFDRKDVGIGRLEKTPLCPHVSDLIFRNVGGHDEIVERRSSEATFSVTTLKSFGAPLGHDQFMGPTDRFFDSDVIDKEQPVEGVVADTFNFYDAAYIVRGVWRDDFQIVSRLWLDEVDALLDEEGGRPVAFDREVRRKLECLRSDVISVDESDSDDSDSTGSFMFSGACQLCVRKRRIKMFYKNRVRV